MAMDSGHRCERARAWASLRVDDELSQLESALLDAHLRDCATCSAFAARIAAATVAVREAGLLQLPHPVLVPVRRRRAHRGVAGAVVAAAMIAATAAGAVFGLQSGGQAGTFRPTAVVASGNESTNVFRNLRRAQLVAQSRPIPRNKSFF
jgi:anti-sigma factor RsiW